MTRRKTLLAAAIAGLAIHSASAQQAPQRPEQVPGAIRSRITLVPLDVRVMDRNGVPVTGLTEKDFRIYEDGRLQQIGHFAFQELTAEAPGPARPPLRKALDASIEEQRHRVFLIVLGRGRLNRVTKGYDAAIQFVRERLLPQDKIAIAAWNRSTDFTTEHARVATLLEKMRGMHERVESRLQQRESGLEAIYGSREMPPALQRDIDAVFDSDPALRPRELASVRIRDEQALTTAIQRETDAMMERMRGESGPLRDPFVDEFFRQAHVGRQSLSTLYAGIEYLKYFDGEKHLILLTDQGIYLPRAEDDEGLAATASDARVAVHTVLTGGVSSSGSGLSDFGRTDARVIGSSGPLQSVMDTAVRSSSAYPSNFGAMFANSTMRTFSRLSGGYHTSYRMTSAAFDRIDKATRSQYLLGYYPADSNWNGKYRRIEVYVNRPGVQVSARRGYFATDQLVPFDRRRFLTYSRVSQAGYYSKPIDDIKVTLKATASGSEIVAEGTIDPSKLTLEAVDGVRGGEVDLAVFVGDRGENLIGEQWQKISLKLGEIPYQRMAKNGLPFTVRVPIKGAPRYVKAIVYDYASDLVGSATVKLR